MKAEMKYKDRFSQEIFNKNHATLDILQQEFIEIHMNEYGRYQKEVARIFREAMYKKGKKLHDSYYEKIYQLYIDRLTIDDVNAAVRQCQDRAPVLYGMGYCEADFAAAKIARHGEIKGRNVSRHEYNEDHPWYYAIYKASRLGYTPGMKFEPWSGFVEVPQKPTVEDEIRKIEHTIHGIERNIRLLKHKGPDAKDAWHIPLWEKQLKNKKRQLARLKKKRGKNE